MSPLQRTEHILSVACKHLGLERDHVELSVNIVTPARMRELNKKYRGTDKATDVLSFPLLTKVEVAKLMSKRAILNIGDLFINRVDAKERLPFLVVHGFLHLLGYDHERTPEEEKVMFLLQDEIINNLRN